MTKSPLLARAAALAIVLAAILVPISAIRGKVQERERRATEVTNAFAQETSGPQQIAGPYLLLTCEENGRDPCPAGVFEPKNLAATASAPVDVRRRGIYAIRVFHADLDLAATFEWPEAPRRTGEAPRKWKDAYIVMSTSDPRGVRKIASDAGPAFLDGHGLPELERYAIRQSLGPWTARKPGDDFSYRARLAMVGTTSLTVVPVGEKSDITMRSNWPHPSFSRDWSPVHRDVTRDGFEARWQITSIATGGRAGRGAGVTFFEPINVYSLSHRAIEYAFLFVLFTLAALALAEIVAGVRMHVVQYALVACAVAVFFLLLLALSEHLHFTLAYGIATLACVGLLTFYLRHPLGTLARTSAFFAFLGALYGSLYVVLLDEDHALLLGSVLVFSVLAAAMVATRRVDWHALPARLTAS